MKTQKNKTRFWTYEQNYSGVYFLTYQEFGIGKFMIIEATNTDEAHQKFRAIGAQAKNFYDYCHCCGPRWPCELMKTNPGTNTPEIGNVSLHQHRPMHIHGGGYIHYYDGRIERIDVGKRPVINGE